MSFLIGLYSQIKDEFCTSIFLEFKNQSSVLTGREKCCQCVSGQKLYERFLFHQWCEASFWNGEDKRARSICSW